MVITYVGTAVELLPHVKTKDSPNMREVAELLADAMVELNIESRKADRANASGISPRSLGEGTLL